MPKVKTHSGAAKRFKVTKNGKITRAKAFGNHMLEKKSQDRKRGYDKPDAIAKADKSNVRKLLNK